jgi:hypothetical protein
MSIASGGISIHDLEYSHAFSTLPTITVQPFPSFWWGIRSPTLSLPTAVPVDYASCRWIDMR